MDWEVLTAQVLQHVEQCIPSAEPTAEGKMVQSPMVGVTTPTASVHRSPDDAPHDAEERFARRIIDRVGTEKDIHLAPTWYRPFEETWRVVWIKGLTNLLHL